MLGKKTLTELFDEGVTRFVMEDGRVAVAQMRNHPYYNSEVRLRFTSPDSGNPINIWYYPRGRANVGRRRECPDVIGPIGTPIEHVPPDPPPNPGGSVYLAVELGYDQYWLAVGTVDSWRWNHREGGHPGDVSRIKFVEREASEGDDTVDREEKVLAEEDEYTAVEVEDGAVSLRKRSHELDRFCRDGARNFTKQLYTGLFGSLPDEPDTDEMPAWRDNPHLDTDTREPPVPHGTPVDVEHRDGSVHHHQEAGHCAATVWNGVPRNGRIVRWRPRRHADDPDRGPSVSGNALLTKEEGDTLVDVLRSISGRPDSTRRGHADAVLNRLREAGFEGSGFGAPSDLSGGIEFKPTMTAMTRVPEPGETVRISDDFDHDRIVESVTHKRDGDVLVDVFDEPYFRYRNGRCEDNRGRYLVERAG